MITRIEATKYRCFDKLAIPMGEFSVFAGVNGSGKTTLLDIPILLGDLLRSDYVSAAFMNQLQDRGVRASSLDELVFKKQGESFVLAVEALLPDDIVKAFVAQATKPIQKKKERWPTHIRYECRLEIQKSHQLVVKNEYLFTFPLNEEYEQNRLPVQGENASKSEDWRFIVSREASQETAFFPELKVAKERTTDIDDTLLAFPKLKFESIDEFPSGRWLLNLLTNELVFFFPQWEELRKSSPPGLSERLMSSGKNLPWLALRLQQNDPKRFASWIEHVQTGLPQIESIEVKEREDDHHAYFKVRYEGGHEVTSTGLSEGTLRVFAQTLVAYIPEQPKVLIVEEPENGIHPQAIDTVLQSLQSLYKSQVWISTHSPIVLADLKLSQLVCTRLERSGEVIVTAGTDHPRLAKWKGAIDLGSLFATGVFE